MFARYSYHSLRISKPYLLLVLLLLQLIKSGYMSAFGEDFKPVDFDSPFPTIRTTSQNYYSFSTSQ
jgi:hypothetical protein